MQQVRAEQVRQGQSSFIGNSIAESLEHKMYAVIENGVVLGFNWDNNPIANCDFVLMTEHNSPAYVGGFYRNGKFYERESNG